MLLIQVPGGATIRSLARVAQSAKNDASNAMRRNQLASNVKINASLNAGINEKLLPFSHEAIVAKVAADADLAPFQSFGHSGFVAGIGFENGDVRVRTELCGNLGGITDDTVNFHSWILGHEVRGDELAQTRMIGQYAIQESGSLSHAETVCMLLNFEFCSLDF